MKKNLLKLFVAIGAIVMLATFTSCEEEEPINQNQQTTQEEPVQNDFFDKANGRGLGDVAQDMLKDGDNIFITVSFSNSIEKMNASTGKSSRFDTGNNAETPRSMVLGSDGYLYVTCYYPRSVVRYDPVQQKVTAICELGDFQPEGIAEVSGKLYIASGYITDENYNYQYDNKLYVVDMYSFSIVETITVGVNPDKVKKLDNNHIVYNTLGDYVTDNGGLYVMDVNDNSITKMDVSLYNFDVYNGFVYGYTSIYSGNPLAFYKMDASGHGTQLNINWTATDNPYGISVNPFNGDIIVTSDGNYTANGDCYVYNNDCTLRKGGIELGLLPCKAVALDGDKLIVLNQGNWGSNNASVSKIILSK